MVDDLSVLYLRFKSCTDWLDLFLLVFLPEIKLTQRQNVDASPQQPTGLT